jgi:hypothetical protein
MFEPGSSIELGGYYAVESFKKLLNDEEDISQLGFYGGDPDVLSQVRFPPDEDLLYDAIFRNDAGCEYGTLVTPRVEDPELPFPYTLQVEVFDYTTGMTGTMVVPFSWTTEEKPFTIYRPVVLGFQTNGIMEENLSTFGAYRQLLIWGAIRNPEHEKYWDKYFSFETIPTD